MSTTSHLSGSGTASGLFLRFQLFNARVQEVYLFNGLRIGHNQGNTIQLAYDDQVARTHAHVTFAPDGTARLQCLSPEAQISLETATVSELELASGVRFRIGQTQFECVSGLRQPLDTPAELSLTRCPFCACPEVLVAPPGPQECPACHQPVLVLQNVPQFLAPIVLPRVYDNYNYCAERYVAHGGMGLVLQGVRQSDHQPVVIKLLLPDKSQNRQAFERFRHDIAITRQMRHPNVVGLLKYGHEKQWNYLVLEWIEGHTLREIIGLSKQNLQSVPFEQAIRWFEQICNGLAALHAVGVVHRDLKPSNILIRSDSTAKISDLGIAKSVDDDDSAITAMGEAPGTYNYMSPEQRSAPDTVDRRTDLHSLGVTFYELLTGEQPIGTFPHAFAVNTTVPKWFDKLLFKLLAPEPQNRCNDIHEVIAWVKTEGRIDLGRLGTSTSKQYDSAERLKSIEQLKRATPPALTSPRTVTQTLVMMNDVTPEVHPTPRSSQTGTQILKACPLCKKDGRPRDEFRLLYGHLVCRKCYFAFANRRQLCFVIDWLGMCVVTFLLVLLVARVGATSGSLEADAAAGNIFTIVVMIFPVFKDCIGGRSPGKAICGVRVICESTGASVGVVASIKRNLPLLIPLMPLVVCQELLKGHRTGDGWSNTKVIWKKYADHPIFQPWPQAAIALHT